MSHSTIYAGVTLENLSKDSFSVSNIKVIKNAVISTVKDENLMFIRISSTDSKLKMAPTGYPVIDMIIFDKFIHEGKATIKLPKSSVQVLINNCPPADLKLFITTLKVKLNSNTPSVQQLRKTKSIGKLFPSTVTAMDVISPICKSDVRKLQEKKLEKGFKDSMPVTPDKKRKIIFNDEDFMTPPNRKLKLEHSTSTPISNVLKELNIPKESVQKSVSVLDKSLNDSFELTQYFQLSSEQISIIEKVKLGQNVFFTGSAGTGKTFLLKKIIGSLPPQSTIITASTGIAASIIDGCTLHNFAGIGSVIKSLSTSISLVMKKPQILLQWRKCKHLIIDEISLISAEFFDHLDQIGRAVRNTPNEPFGGIQMIVSGDFFQLPPVMRRDYDPKTNYKFAFQSKVWNEAFPEIMFLTQVKRQSDKEFVKLLSSIRIGLVPDWADKRLKATSKQVIEKNGVIPTKLCTHKIDVEEKNSDHIESLKGEAVVFTAVDSVPDKEHYMRDICQADQEVTLKIGAQVMLIKNIDLKNGLANGARGVVVEFKFISQKRFPVVRFASGKTFLITPELFTVAINVGGNKIVVVRKQVPLKLAYALSIHKSQGMTLDCVDLYLSKSFESGQAYVALSRCKSIHSMRVINWQKHCVKVDRDVVNFYKKYQPIEEFYE